MWVLLSALMLDLCLDPSGPRRKQRKVLLTKDELRVGVML